MAKLMVGTASGGSSREVMGYSRRKTMRYSSEEVMGCKSRVADGSGTGVCMINESRWMRATFRILLYTMLILLLSGAVRTAAAKQTASSSRKVVLYQGQTQKLKRKGVSGNYEWSSSDPEIAEVDGRGRVTALTPGRCKVTVENGKKSITYKVRVKALKFTKPNVTMVRGRQYRLTFNCPGITGMEWESSDPEIAEVRDGVIYAKKAGNAVITARWRMVEVKCGVTVTGISMDLLTEAYPPTKENRKKIVLAGSSSMDYWSGAPQAFAPQEVINTAIEGTTVTQWQSWYRSLITRYQPSAVVLYVGSNDLGDGKGISGEQNAANTIQLLDRISAELEDTPVFYISINPCWFRKDAWDKIRVSNALVESHCMKNQNMYYIDVTKAFSRPDGTPDQSLFLADQLHPSPKGYAVWEACVVPQVRRVLAAAS